jgi:phosphoglycerate dehydrogenase-like enzyme
MSRVAVCSKSFSKNPILRDELLKVYPGAKFNDAGRELQGAELVEFLLGFDRVVIGLEKLDSGIFAQLPDLKLISKYGVGLDSIDFPALRKHGVKLSWTGGVNRRSVSELVIAQILTLLRELHTASALVRSGGWRQIIGANLTGKTVGIIGLGHIGKDLTQLLQPFGCKILANDVVRFDEFSAKFGVEQVSKEFLLKNSDIVTVHVPLDHTTRGFIGAHELAMMKLGSILINSARGSIVDETALKHALKNGPLAAAALDVFDREPPPDLELIEMPNLFSTPHLGGSSLEAVLAMGRAAIKGLSDGKDAFPENFK